MPHPSGFLHAILRTSDNDGPRQKYADWLQKNGQRDRADFIRIQCALAALPMDDARRRELHIREVQLLQKNREGWLKDDMGRLAQTLGHGVIFRRGFADYVSLHAPQNAARDDIRELQVRLLELLKETTITRASIDNQVWEIDPRDGQIRYLRDSAPLGHFSPPTRTHRPADTPFQIEFPGDLSHLGKLRRLGLGTLTPESLHILSQTSQLSGLDVLLIGRPENISNAQFQDLLNIPHFKIRSYGCLITLQKKC